MEDLIQRINERFGEPVTGCAAGYQFFHWKAHVENVAFVIYLTVYHRGGSPVGYVSVLCEANGQLVFSAGVRRAEDMQVIEKAVDACIAQANS